MAINASGSVSDPEDFDRAVFGHSFQQADRIGQTIGYGFNLDGAFTRSRDATKTPTYAGLFGFREVGFSSVLDPVLYQHPGFSGALPESILELERHFVGCNPDGILVVAAEHGRILATLEIESEVASA